MLRAAGWRTGLFTSPHLVAFAERIRIDGRAASPEAIDRALARVESVPAGAPRTFFEACFGMACAIFEAGGVEFAVVEAGLGGRLDSTNVLEPALCVVTPIGLDHREILGDTLAAIAGEKAGILKPGVPAVTAEQDGDAARVLADAAGAAQAPLAAVGELVRIREIHALDAAGCDVTFDVRGHGDIRARLALVGRHQVDNAALALAAVARLPEGVPAADFATAARAGLAAVRWPGRFEACPGEPRLWWDGAHNVQGAAVARAAWRDALGDPPGALVLGLAEDKDLPGLLAALAGPWRRVYAVAADSPRARPPAEVVAAVRAAWPGTTVVDAGSVAAGVRAALSSLAPGERVLVAGSLFVVGEAMAAHGAGDLSCL